jgi:hypothetical protein
MGKWANDCPERVDSIHDGMLDIWLHSETDRNAGALNELTHDVPKINGSSNSLTYGRVSVRYKQPMSFVGYHYAWLFWPNDSAHANYCDGEMDFPEMNTDSSTISAFAHWANATSCSQADGYSTNIPAVGAWHTETVEWSPSFVKFYLDGNTVGSDTNTAHIASWAEHWVLQFDAGASTLPSNLGSGHIYIDWVTIYARA